MRDFFRIFKKSSKQTSQTYTLVDILKNKYLTFQELLAENNNILMLMADMEEKLSGEYLFDRNYINTNVKAIAEGTKKIIEHINVISNNKYLQLYEVFADINKEIEKALRYKQEIPVSDLCIPLENLTREMTSIAGGKIAHLGEMKKNLGLPTPEGFSITAYAFKRFMDANDLTGKINTRLSEMNIDNMEELNRVSKEIQDMVINADVPDDLQNAIMNAVEGLKLKAGTTTHPNPFPQGEGEPSTIRVSVRSSAIQEDGEFSFAGQYATFLNVSPEQILQKYKEVVASLFTPNAIFYYKTKGFSEEDMVMAVGVLIMVDALSGGVMYARDPNDPEREAVIISAIWGLGKPVVDGTETPNFLAVSRINETVVEERIPSQETMLLCNPEGDVIEVRVPDEKKNKACLKTEQIKTLFDYALSLEKHYDRPQDIEWAVGQDNRVYILQSRPLRLFKDDSITSSIPRRFDNYKILLDTGIIASKGIGYGKAFILKDEEDLKDFPEGAVLVARHTSTKFVTVMNKAAAIITDVGSTVGHMASISREYQVPTILDTETATRVIKSGQEITVDAINGNIYKGRVDELIAFASKKKEPFKDTQLFVNMEMVLKLIVPLSLIDPDSENFRPEYCKSLHDITRFIHEMAMAEIFKTGKGQDIDSFEDMMAATAYAEGSDSGRLGEQTYALRAGIPIDAHLLDIDSCVTAKLKKVTQEDIASVPFSAFLMGLKGMKWPEPRPVDAKGFLGMIANTASTQEAELLKMGGKSYAIISHNYMNFSIRLGYHFSMVEAYAGENINDNYIKFFFKGGGAANDRRLRRVRLIKEILKEMDFKVDVTEDVMHAMLTKYKQSTIEDKLEVMGKLTVYTKQLDMVMYNDAVTDMFIEDFIRDHMKKRITASEQ